MFPRVGGTFLREFNVFMGALKIAKSDTRGGVGNFTLHEKSSEISNTKTTLPADQYHQMTVSCYESFSNDQYHVNSHNYHNK